MSNGVFADEFPISIKSRRAVVKRPTASDGVFLFNKHDPQKQ